MWIIILFLLATITPLSQAETVSFPKFDKANETKFSFGNHANIALQSLQVTPETRNPLYNLQNGSGRVILKNSYSIWNLGKRVASFNTSFILNIQPAVQGESGGEGLAFVITSASSDYMPDNSHGQWLGLFNSSTNGNPSNKMVAVEFDTTQNVGTNDPDDNHVGININNINSTKIQPLDPQQINLKGGAEYNITAWITYDGVKQRLEVYLAKSSNTKPSQPILWYEPLDLSDVLDPDAYFGFSASTGNETELNCVLSWNLTIDPAASEKPPDDEKSLVVGLSVALSAAFVAIITTVALFFMYRKSRGEEEGISGALENLPGRPREFKYKDLKKATQNFRAEVELGRGGFGAVYKGVLQKEKTTVAVKRMLKDYKQGKEEFISEISIINQLRHRNLVQLLGWCYDKAHLIMVYDYMPNGSLDRHIYKGLLDWEKRYNIVSAVASSLFYLHEECNGQVIHRDVKASNIMLDSDWNARLGDFGLARLLELDGTSHASSRVAGTMGYIAPEYYYTGRATTESDVFSFGAVALEVACGRPPRVKDGPDLVSWVWKLHGEDKLLQAADSRLAMPDGDGDVKTEDIVCLLMVGLACSNPNAGERPTMRQVTQILARNMAPPSVPQVKPPLVWPSSADPSLGSSFGTSNSAISSTDHGMCYVDVR